MSQSLAFTCVVITSAVLAPRVQAQVGEEAEPPPQIAEKAEPSLDLSSEADGWSFQFTPFVWLASADGTVGVKGVELDFDASFSDILRNIDLALMGRLEVHRGPWQFFLAGVYMEGSDSTTFNVPVFEKIEIDLDMGIFEFGAGYQVAEWETDRGHQITLDVLAGARYFTVDGKARITLDPPGPVLPSRVTLDQDKDWIDPIVGLKLVLPFSDECRVGVRGDVGGFGVGSDFAWNLIAGFEYDFTPGFGVVAGYRILDIDYEDGSGSDEFTLDARFRGPIIGFSLRF